MRAGQDRERHGQRPQEYPASPPRTRVSVRGAQPERPPGEHVQVIAELQPAPAVTARQRQRPRPECRCAPQPQPPQRPGRQCAMEPQLQRVGEREPEPAAPGQEGPVQRIGQRRLRVFKERRAGHDAAVPQRPIPVRQKPPRMDAQREEIHQRVHETGDAVLDQGRDVNDRRRRQQRQKKKPIRKHGVGAAGEARGRAVGAERHGAGFSALTWFRNAGCETGRETERSRSPLAFHGSPILKRKGKQPQCQNPISYVPQPLL